MDYLDPKKEFQHRMLLMVGYILVAVAITLSALILLYQAYGFGFGKNGTLIQNGLVFFSSQPNPANIYINGQLSKSQTNARMVLPEGTYRVRLTRSGYRDWQRTIQLNGGTVEHYDYPLLVPATLPTKPLSTLDSAPPLATQSPDRRWLLLQQAGSLLDFQLYDLKNPAKAVTPLSLPSSVVSDAIPTTSWQLIQWADDNQHILLKHLFGQGKFEYVLVDRSAPQTSVNLSSNNNLTAPDVRLKNLKSDQYYAYDPASGSLQSVSLGSTTITPVLEHVLAYKSYGSDTILYATDNGAPAGKTYVKLLSGTTTYTLKTLNANTTYLLDLTQYSGTLYVALGDTGQNKVYIYKDPIGQLQAAPRQALIPSQVFHITEPNYLSFSTSAQYIVAENGQNFDVYDIENQQGYTYTTHQPLDAPQPHATWMDGNRLTYISGAKQLIFDYDDTNQQLLSPALPAYLPVFSPDFTYVYTLEPTSEGKTQLLQTSLLAASDR